MPNKLIVCDPDISFGMPTLNGRRLTVYNIVTKLYYEETLDLALKDYDITLSEAKAAINYCQALCCQNDRNKIHFCDGCILRTIEEVREFNKNDYQQIDEKLTISIDRKLIYLGSIEDLDDEEFGKPGWAIASMIKAKYSDTI